MAKNELSALGDIIRSHRMTHKMGRLEFSNRAGITQRALTDIETGTTQRPRDETVRKIASAMDIPYPDLLSELDRLELTGPGGKLPTIYNERLLLEKLSGRPPSWDQVLAVRTALRALPNVGGSRASTEKHLAAIEKFLLALFRSIHIAWCTSRYGGPTGKLAGSARKSLEGAADTRKLPQGAFEAGGAIFWATTARGRRNAAVVMDWATRSLSKEKKRANDLWTAISSDCTGLNSNLPPRNLAASKLWPDGQPLWFMDAWHSFENMLRSLGPEWAIWARWYEARLNGNRTLGLGPESAEKVDRFISKQPNTWWDRSAAKISTDVNEFIRGLSEEADLAEPADGENYGDTALLTQRPAPHQFGERHGRIFAHETVSRLGISSLARDIWKETVEKAKRAAERLRRTQAPEHIVQSVERLITSLGNDVDDVAPGLLLMRSRTIEADLATFDTEQAKGELMTDAQSLLRDLSASLEDLRALFPEILEIEAARIAQKVAEGAALPAFDRAKQVMAEARASDVVDKSAIDALDAVLIDLSEVETVIGESTNDIVTATAVQKRANLISLHLLDVRNFSASVLKAFKHFGGDVAKGGTRIIAKGATDVSKRAYKGALDGVEESTKAGVKIAFAALVTGLAGPLAGLAIYVGSFVSLSRKANEVVEKIGDDDDDKDEQVIV